MNRNLRHSLVFLITLGAFAALMMGQTRKVAGFRVHPVDFAELGTHDYVVGSGWSRRQEASIKLGYLENHEPPRVGLFGNHQVQFFGGLEDPDFDEPAEFFNYWYANLSLTELRDYVFFADHIGKLPGETLIVHITTPNNDNGAHILGHTDELPEDIRHFHARQQARGSLLRSLAIQVHQAWSELRYLLDWKTLAASVLGKNRYLLVDMRDCKQPEVADVASGPGRGRIETRVRSLLARVGVSTASALPEQFHRKQLRRLCVGDLMHVIRRDGSAFRNTNMRDLVLNEEPLDSTKTSIRAGDERAIAEQMRDIHELAESRGRRVVFLITPVHETQRPSSVNDVFSAALELVPDVAVIDHREKFRDARYFESYDHPNHEYFEEVAGELRRRGYLED